MMRAVIAKRRVPGAPRLKEADIQRTCVDFLALDGWRPLKTDPCSDRNRGKGFGEKGMADHLFLRVPDVKEYVLRARRASLTRGPFPAASVLAAAQGQILWVEFKRPGTVPTSRQHDWHYLERYNGFLTVLAGVDFPADIDGFMAWYRVSGLMRRPI